MYKYIGAILFGLFWTLPLQAAWTEANCNVDNGGELVTFGNETFCRSRKAINWWSAAAWCERMGGHLATMSEICPNAASLTHSASCGRTVGDVWSSTAVPGTSNMWVIRNFGTTMYNDGNRNNSGSYKAFCK